MKQTVVKATVGRQQGSRPSRRLRAQGQLPGVVYGLDLEPRAVAVAYNDLRDALKAGGANAVLSLDIGGETEMVLVRDLQRDPIKRVVTHADFLRIDPNQKVTVSIPLEIMGEPELVLEAGGFIEIQRFDLEVEVSPTAIPESIEVDVTTLEMDDRISVGDLNLPDGIISLIPEEISIVTTSMPSVEKAADDEEGAEDETEAGEDEASSEDESSSEGGDE